MRASEAAFVLAGAAAAAFGLLAWSTLVLGALQGVDDAVAAWVHARSTPAGMDVLSVVSRLHGPRAIAMGMFGAAACLLLWRQRGAAVMVLVTVLGGAWINHGLKHGIQRPRPGHDIATAASSDFGFPSGHVANAVLLYGALAVLLAGSGAPRAARVAAFLAAGAIVALVAMSRLALNAHRFSDVLGGALVGVAWLGLCAGAWWIAAGQARPQPAPLA